jgi:hypothetical protein
LAFPLIQCNMSVDSAGSEASDCSPVPVAYGPEENCSSLQMPSAEMFHTDTASPLPYAMDLRTQDSPDSSMRPKARPQILVLERAQ